MSQDHEALPSLGIEVEDQITPEFFTKVLGRKDVEEVLRVAQGTKSGDNYMSSMYSVQVRLTSGDLRDWLLKCYAGHPVRQRFANKTNMFYKEFWMYKEWFPLLQRFQEEELRVTESLVIIPSFAPFVGGRCIDYDSLDPSELEDMVVHPLENAIVLLDMRSPGAGEYQMCDRQIGLDFPHCKLVVEELAKCHALTWAYQQYHQLDSITDKFPILDYKMDEEDFDSFADILDGSINLSVDALDNQFGPQCELGMRLRNFKSKFHEILRVFYGKDEDECCLDHLLDESKMQALGNGVEDEVPWRLLCHGDCWINNFLFKYPPSSEKGVLRKPPPSQVVMVDHAVARPLCPTVELAYMLYTSTSHALRKNYMDDLLSIYASSFLQSCQILRNTQPPPSFSLSLLRRKFQRAKLYGFTIAILALPMFLKNSSEIVDIDEMPIDPDLNYADLMTKAMYATTSKINPIFQARIVDIVQEMVAEGLL